MKASGVFASTLGLKFSLQSYSPLDALVFKHT